MNSFGQVFDAINIGGESHGLTVILITILLAFVQGQLIGWVYCWTHSGVSYSRSFVQSLVLIPVIVSLVMLIVSNNIITTFGLLGAMALIRFRNVLKDTWDTVFVLMGLILGMAVGSQRYATSLAGTIALVSLTLYLHITQFGSRGRFDAFLNLRIANEKYDKDKMSSVLKRFCFNTKQISMRHLNKESAVDIGYHILLRDKNRGQDLISSLEAIDGVQNVSLTIQPELQEV